MKEKTLKFLEKNLSSEPSTFAEEAKWRQENEVWLKWSQGIAMKIIDYMHHALGVLRSMSARYCLVTQTSHSRV
mgnify:CR=1 FL=1